jgi:hypothetical protein
VRERRVPRRDADLAARGRRGDHRDFALGADDVDVDCVSQASTILEGLFEQVALAFYR